ncbi:hypothetical protein JB92DRAFT_3196178 [Gautieria morchelliformis]|nr:hypothetical protein JB92DRAFT_3196178 [Gautieria morchelliformis]
MRNGINLSASAGAVVLGEVLTAMGTEALLGPQANFAPSSVTFGHTLASRALIQIEASSTLDDLLFSSSLASSAASHADEVTIAEDAGELRLERHSLRILLCPRYTQAMTAVLGSLDATTIDAVQRLKTAASAVITPILDIISLFSVSTNGDLVGTLGAFRLSFAKRRFCRIFVALSLKEPLRLQVVQQRITL